MQTDFFYSKFSKDNTLESRFCIGYNNGLTSTFQKANHTCIKNIKRAAGRFVCNACPTECYDIQEMWNYIDETKNHKGKSSNGSRAIIVHKGNTDLSCLCAKCNKGFTNSISCQKHYDICAKKTNCMRQHTIKYVCKKCGKCSIMKHSAARHFRQCKINLTGGNPTLAEQLHVDRRKVELNLKTYNELSITRKIFKETSNVFADIGDKHIIGMCVFQVEAVRLSEGEVEEKRDIYFTSNTEESHDYVPRKSRRVEPTTVYRYR